MILLIPLALSTFGSRLIARVLYKRGFRWVEPWDSWSAAAGIGMAVVYVSTSVAHFVQPQRSGLIAIVPQWLPGPDTIVTMTGFVELLIAIALLIPRTRRWAGIVSVIFLLGVLPANVVAAAGVSHPAAPSTPLITRIPLQLVFIAVSLVAATKSKHQVVSSQ